VFHSYHDDTGGIYVMDADGNNQRRLTHSFADQSPSWSPDGQQIAFQRYQDDDQNHIYNIFVMDADSGNVKQVTDFWGAGDPKWSPDGQWILFEGSELHPIRPDGTETGDIFAIRPDGTDLWQVTETIPDTWRLLGGWSPGGKQILYKEVVNDLAIEPTPVIATLHPAKLQRVFKRVPVKMPRMRFYMPRFSADGKSIFFSSKQDGNSNIYRFGLVDKQLTQLTNSPGKDSAPQEWNPRLPVSPQELTPTLWGEIKTTK
jgi:Tol biopolymer transport system component